MNHKVFNLVLIMRSGYVHQVKIKAKNRSEAKDYEMTLIKVMMEIDFWKEIDGAQLVEVLAEAPKFSTDYAEFLKEVRSLRGRR